MSNLNKKILLFVMLVGVAFGLVGCSTPENSVRIRFAEDEYEIRLNETKLIEPTIIKSSQVGDVELVYTSSDESVVKVVDGVLVPVAMGEATIKVEWANRDIIFDKATVKVIKASLPQPVLSFEASMLKGDTQVVSVSLGNNLTEATYTITALNPEVATITGNEISAVAVGTAKFEVKVADYEESETYEFEVKVEESDFAIIYNLDGGTNHAENPAGYNALALPLPLKEAEKLGYTFLGWYHEGEKVEAIPAGTLGDYEVTAKWQINEYTISFAGFEGAEFEAGYVLPSVYTVESDEIVFANPTKLGYKFLGWYAGEEKVEKVAKGSTGNVAVEAKWEIEEFSVSYDLAGGKLGTGYSTFAEIGADFLADFNKYGECNLGAAEFAKESHPEVKTALGNVEMLTKWQWYFEFMLEDLKAIHGDTTNAYVADAYPVLEKLIALDTNAINESANARTLIRFYSGGMIQGIKGSEGNETFTALCADFSVVAHQEALLAAANPGLTPSYTVEDSFKFALPEKVGYTFLGWYNADGEKLEGIAKGSTGNVSVTAKWEIVNYSITYTTAHGTLPGYATVDEAIADFIADYNKARNKSLTAADFAALGPWTQISDASLFLYNTEYRAKWAWLVDYIAEVAGSANKKAYQNFNNYNSQKELNAANSNYIYCIAYELRGWVGQTQYTRNANFKSGNYGDAAVSALMFDYCGLPSTHNIETKDIVLPVLAEEGYVFLGWYIGETQVEKIAAGTLGDLEVVAKWREVIRYPLTWNLEGGAWETGKEGAVDFAEGTYGQVVLPTPVKKYHVFLGWFNAAGEKVEAFTADQAYEVTAKWEDQRINGGTQYILFVLDGGDWKEGQVPGVDVTDYVEVLKLIPVKYGYKFAEWLVESDNETTPVTVIYTAVWEEVQKYSITYVLDGGEAQDNPTEYTSESLPIVLAPATKEGYEFLGWFDGETEVKEIVAGTTGDLTLTAKWNQIQTEEPEQPVEPEQPEEKVVYVGEGKDYATLDEAVQGVEDGTKIVLAAGEYALSVVIAKSVVIEGPNADLAPAEFKAEEAVINVAKDVAGNLAAKNIEFNGVHIKGVGGGAGISGVTFQDGGSIETLVFKSCVLSDTNTLLKFQGSSDGMTLNIENCHIHTIGQFILWVTKAISKTTLVGNVVDGSTCGAIENSAAALFRVRFGSLEAYNNVFNGDSSNTPGYFECSAEASVVKYNTFNDVTLFVHPTAKNNVVFDENLYLTKGNVEAAAPATLTGTGVTADATVATSEEDRASRYEAAFAPEQPEEEPQAAYALTFDLAGGQWGTAPFTTHEEMKLAFLADMAEYLKSLGQAVESIDPVDQTAEHLTDFFGISYAQRDNIPAFFLTDETYSAKWKWMYDYVASVSAADLSNSTVLRSNIHGFVYATIKEKWPVSYDFSNVSFGDYKDLMPATLGTAVVAPTEYAYGVALELPTPVKEGATFAGWTLNGQAFAGITETTKGDLNLVATWK